MLFQSYVIWKDRINAIYLVTYSYGSYSNRSMDTAFVEKMTFCTDYINAGILIQDATGRPGVIVMGWQKLYKDRKTVIEWETKVIWKK